MSVNSFKQPRRVMSRVLMAAAFCFGAPAMGQIDLPAPVERRSLTDSAFETGILSPSDGALPETLWTGTDSTDLGFLLGAMPTRPRLPAVGNAMRRVLLNPGAAPDYPDQNAANSLGGQKLLALVNAGFIEEARTIASLSDAPRNDPATGKALALADLLTGRNQDACQRGANLTENRAEPFWVQLRTFCYAIAGEADAADLTLGLMRDQGLIDFRLEEFFSPLISGASPKQPLRPRTALELAIVRHLNMPLTAGLFTEADGSVIRAITMDETLEPAARIDAARRAVSMGIMTPRAFAALLGSIDTGLTNPNPAAMLVAEPASPLTDAVVYKAVASLSSPEFLRDKADLIANALISVTRAQSGFAHQYSIFALYADDIKGLDGAVVPPAHAGMFALARMAVGDANGATRWLFAMRGEEDFLALGPELSDEYVRLTGYLALIAPDNGNAVAEAAGIAVPEPQRIVRRDGSSPAHDQMDGLRAAKITELIFDAAMPGPSIRVDHLGAPIDVPGMVKTGQAALAGLALEHEGDGTANPVFDVLQAKSFEVAGLGDLRGQLAFEERWRRDTPTSTTPQRRPRSQPDEDDFAPSLKPRPGR